MRPRISSPLRLLVPPRAQAPGNLGACDDQGEAVEECLGGLLGASVPHDDDLMRLVETWDRLPGVVRRALVAAAEAAVATDRI